MSDVKKLQPQEVFTWFYELNQIPRGSGNEKAASDFLFRFAKERNLEVEQDEALNIIIRKPGTAGYEKSPLVTLQGHMDMVCEKTPESTHDFEQDPIDMIIDGDWLRANNTTLGADNGVAVAYALAILDSDDIPHPNLEVLITTEEETGMGGAKALKPGQVKGQFLLNLDSDEEGTFLLGCAGGADFFTSFPAKKEVTETSQKAYSLRISGLKGGHSGQVIHEGRGNAIKIMARILHDLKKKGNVKLASISGGSKHNAIPSIAEVVFAAEGKVAELVQQSFREIKAELGKIEPDLEYELKDTEATSFIPETSGKNIIDYLFVVPHGVQSMSPDIEGLVQTSLNVAIVSEKEDRVLVQHSLRSAVNSSRKALLDRLFCLAERFEAKADSYGEYPAWEFNPASPLIDIVKDIYLETTGKEPILTAIHAGLECGILKEVMPDTEMISFGPKAEDIHTPRERLNIPSTERVWNFLLRLLASFKG